MNFIAVEGGAYVEKHEAQCDTETDDHRGHDGNQIVVDTMSAPAIQNGLTGMSGVSCILREAD